ncbi:MAG: hypothetical protein HN929_11510 [Chloroflexi bacterium]|jgi:hypothetical protein|nr:hypothetical protein [Chloroflexota bacterium]
MSTVTKYGVVLSNRIDLPVPSNNAPYQPGHWRRTVVDDPFVMKDGSVYRMLLSGLGVPPNLYPFPFGSGAQIWSLGEARASALTGPWVISNSDSPLLAPWGGDDAGGWRGGHILSSMYFWDPLAGAAKIVYQTSSGEDNDGDKIGWTDNEYSLTSPDYELFTAPKDTMGDPFAVHDGTNYHMFYSFNVSGTWYVYKRKSATWEGLASDVTATQLFEGGSMGLFQYSGVWYMVYGKWDAGDSKNKIYMAISTDLESWQPMFDGEAAFDPTETYHRYGAQDPSLYIENGIVYIYYSGIADANNPNGNTAICLVTVELDTIDDQQADTDILLQISNKALRKIGVREISSLDEDSGPAKRCQSTVVEIIKEVLSLHPWGSATVWGTLSLSADSTAPFGYQYSYDLPRNAISVVDVRPIGSLAHLGSKFERTNTRKLYTDVSPCYVRYVAYDLAYLNGAPPLFLDTCAYRLAIEISKALSTRLPPKIWEEYYRTLEDAKLADTVENYITEPDTNRNSSILAAREYPAATADTDEWWLA